MGLGRFLSFVTYHATHVDNRPDNISEIRWLAMRRFVETRQKLGEPFSWR